jgi:N,N'-diacetyllegionaminate synthase
MKFKTKIIAEVGINHNKSVYLAKKLIKKAKDAGADYVKFQIFNPSEILSIYAKKSSYQKINSSDNESQLSMVKKFELKNNDFLVLKEECKKRDIKFLCSPFDINSATFLNKIGEKIIKIPSGEITNLILLKEIGKFKIKIILSTGMSNLKEIDQAINILVKGGTKRKNISLLQCVTAYPTPMKYVNLKALTLIKKKFNLEVGFSDHTKGIEASIAAVALGAKIIEKHITLDKNALGPDHKSSLNPEEFKEMVKSIRNIELALGTEKKKLQSCEKENLIVARKSIVAKKKIKKGEIFSQENLTTKRPGNGINPMKWYRVIGRRANKNYKEDELIK